jgi:hypothetical protein
MSTLEVNKITPQSGTGITLGDSGDTFTIPSGVTLDGSSATLTGFASTNGITMADQFILTADFTGNANPISSNLARISSAGQGTLGTGMTVSSGVFAFPSTGIYLVTLIVNVVETDGGTDGNVGSEILIATDNASYITRARAFSNLAVNNVNNNMVCQTLVDVTDTSNVKVRFDINDNVNLVRGGSTNNQTSMMFIRLGDT